MRIDGIIFDLDGTLFEADYNWDEIRRKLGVKGRLILEHFKTLPKEEKIEKEKRLEEIEGEVTKRGRLRPGVIELLSYLKSQKISLALVTNNTRKNADYIVEKYSLPFDVIVTREDGVYKPQKESISLVLEKMGLPKEKVASIGDNEYDIMAASEAGIPYIFIVNEDRERFRKYKNVVLLKNIFELLDRLKQGVDMKRVRVALGSNDGENISPSHMGLSKEFYVYDLSENGKYELIEKKENTSPKEVKYGDTGKMKAVIEILKDCDVFVGRRLSPNFIKLRDNTEFQPLVTEIESISGLMETLSKSFDKIYSLVESRRRGERPEEIPMIRKE